MQFSKKQWYIDVHTKPNWYLKQIKIWKFGNHDVFLKAAKGGNRSLDNSQVAPSLLDISWKARNQPPAPALIRNGCTSLGLLGIFNSVSWKKRVLTMIKLVLFLPTSNLSVRSISLMSYPLNWSYCESRISLTSLTSLTSWTSLIGMTLLARMFLEKCDYIDYVLLNSNNSHIKAKSTRLEQANSRTSCLMFFCWTENSNIFWLFSFIGIGSHWNWYPLNVISILALLCWILCTCTLLVFYHT